MRVVIAVAAISSTIPASAQIARPSVNADVPVTKVVLYSSGVGYFEHAGIVHGNSATELRFKTSQINDILKSIMLEDQGGGRVGAITYPSQDPIAKTLKSFQVDITQNPTLAELLNQLRGAKVTIESQAEHITGTILGVETPTKAVDKGEPVATSVLNVVSGPTIRAIDLQSINNLSFDDPQLQDELAKALAALVQARDQDKKPVTINFNGTGDRHVRVGYVVETPVWKTSYRLLLDDKASFAKLQGWAIVENQTESDWNDVSLSLVSGRPISFIMDLYQPLYATRPTVVPEMFAGLRPQEYDPGLDEKVARTPMPMASAAPAGLGGGRGAVGRRIGYNADGTPSTVALNEIVTTAMAAAPAPTLGFSGGSTVQSIASTAKLGELFQYSVGHVTLARQKSAMLPIIADSVGIERLSIYNASVLATNPLTGVRLTNTTGKHLLQGPVTVLEKAGYSGDARIDNVPPGQERLLSYGIDLDVVMDNGKYAQTSALQTASINKGVLIVTRKLVSSQEYSANNKSTKDKTLIIEHPVHFGWKLVDSPKPVETTPSVYRFKGTATAGKVTTLVVKEKSTQSESIAMLPGDPAQLLQYNRAGEIPAAVRDAIGKAIQLKQRVVDVERQIATHTQHIGEIAQEQNRMRENMKTVATTTQYYQRLLEKLNEQQSSIETLQKERDDFIVQRDALRKQLEDYLGTLTVG